MCSSQIISFPTSLIAYTSNKIALNIQFLEKSRLVKKEVVVADIERRLNAMWRIKQDTYLIDVLLIEKYV